MTLTILAFLDLTLGTKIIMVILIAGFMPLTAWSFLRIMMKKKERDFKKAMAEMGIPSSRKVGDVYNAGRFSLPVIFAFLVCLIGGIYFIFSGELINNLASSVVLEGPFYGNVVGGDKALIAQSLSVLGWAFMGGFLWSAQNIIRRLIGYDLVPSVYYSAGIRIMLASVVALAFSFIIGAEGNSFVKLDSSLTTIAFLSGMFPERVLNNLIKTYKKYILGNEHPEFKSLSLYNIEGISMSHKERLEEIGIDNAQNLATASLTQLIISTPFSARQLLDWIGQAKLICYVKDDIEHLRSLGIRSVFDLLIGEKSKKALQEISVAANINSPLLQVVHDQANEDEGIKALYRFQQRLNSPSRDILVEEYDRESEERKDSQEMSMRGNG